MQVSWLQSEIAQLARQNPVKDNYSELRPIVETWICRLKDESVEEKRKQVAEVACWIRAEKTLTTQQTGYALFLLQKVCLSRRISSLVLSEFYERRVDSTQNHLLTMKGLEHCIRSYFPGINLFVIENSIQHYGHEIRGKNEIWLIVKMKDFCHINLILIQRTIGFTVTVFDSFGYTLGVYGDRNDKMNQFKMFYQEVIEFIVGRGYDDFPVFYYDFMQRRQEGINNSASFILSDLEVALSLIQDKRPIMKNFIPDPLFFSTTQAPLPILRALDVFQFLFNEATTKPVD